MRVLSCLRNSAYSLSHGFTGSIKSTTSRMSSLSNRNADNTRSVTLGCIGRITIAYVLNCDDLKS